MKIERKREDDVNASVVPVLVYGNLQANDPDFEEEDMAPPPPPLFVYVDINVIDDQFVFEGENLACVQTSPISFDALGKGRLRDGVPNLVPESCCSGF